MKPGSESEQLISITDASGAAILQLHMMSWDSGVFLRMPDGTEVMKLVPGAAYGSLEGTHGGKSIQILYGNSISATCSDMVQGKPLNDVMLLEDGSEVARLVAHTHWWVVPVLTFSACIGVCCIHCHQNHDMQIKQNDAVVGNLSTTERKENVLTASDPGALSGALLCQCLNRWLKAYGLA